MGSGTGRRLRPQDWTALWEETEYEDLDAACAHSGCSTCRADCDDDGGAGRRPRRGARLRHRATALRPRWSSDDE